MARKVQVIDDVVIRFAGDSGDGMQITGDLFTNTTAIQGNDLATFPDYPAEIRAPVGTQAGVSGFQIHFSSRDVHTPGDSPSLLVAMNPAALKVNLRDLKPGGMVIVNADKFTAIDLEKADLATNPLEDGTLEGFQVVAAPLGKLTKAAVEGLGLGAKETDRCKNFFALGMTYWLFNRDQSITAKWIRSKFKPPFDEANHRALTAGWNYADTLELFHSSFEIPKAKLPSGLYRNITGNHALALGLLTASRLAGRNLFLGAYPITPASDVLHVLAGMKDLGVITFQAEDEIAAVCATIGAGYAGSIAVTTSSGPGIALKSEAMSLALTAEVPLVVVDVQRGGPSTGLPTKTEQSDLAIAMFGRHGEAPLPVLAASTPADCFDAAIEAVRIATRYMIPVVLLTDGYLANGAEPWRIPDVEKLEPIPVRFASDPESFKPYRRDPETLARPWAIPGTPGLEHRIGGLEKHSLTGAISYDPANHELMCKTRAEHVRRIQQDIPDLVAHGDDGGVLVLGWGGTFGALRTATDRLRQEGVQVAHAHLRWLNPFPANTGALLRRYDKVIVAELNLGQLDRLVRAEFLVDTVPLQKIQGQPFSVGELYERIRSLCY